MSKEGQVQCLEPVRNLLLKNNQFLIIVCEKHTFQGLNSGQTGLCCNYLSPLSTLLTCVLKYHILHQCYFQKGKWCLKSETVKELTAIGDNAQTQPLHELATSLSSTHISSPFCLLRYFLTALLIRLSHTLKLWTASSPPLSWVSISSQSLGPQFINKELIRTNSVLRIMGPHGKALGITSKQ